MCVILIRIFYVKIMIIKMAKLNTAYFIFGFKYNETCSNIFNFITETKRAFRNTMSHIHIPGGRRECECKRNVK